MTWKTALIRDALSNTLKPVEQHWGLKDSQKRKKDPGNQRRTKKVVDTDPKKELKSSKKRETVEKDKNEGRNSDEELKESRFYNYNETFEVQEIKDDRYEGETQLFLVCWAFSYGSTAEWVRQEDLEVAAEL